MTQPKYKIKLQAGDYCRRDIGEEKYREVAQRFFDDGCPRGELIGSDISSPFFGWSFPSNDFYHGDNSFAYGTGRLLTYDQIMEQEPMSNNEWYERGELPPVGIECMQGDSTVRIVAHISNGKYKYAVFQGVNGDVCGYSDRTYFNPLKSDRDRAIEAGVNALKPHHPRNEGEIIEILYDAGLIRLPEGK